VRSGGRLEFSAPLADDILALLQYLRGHRDELGHRENSNLRKRKGLTRRRCLNSIEKRKIHFGNFFY
jgi:hypothetical protein